MKIILTAFNEKLESEPIEVPEEIRKLNKFRFPLNMDVMIKPVNEAEGLLFAEMEKKRVIGVFRWTGKVRWISENCERIEVWALVDIEKF